MPHETGRAGEEIAIDFLAGLGYTIIAHNYCVRGGEIDVIAIDGDTIAFVEVKTRSSARFATARESVTKAKQSRIAKAATHYLATSGWAGFCRFDVIEVYLHEGAKPTIRHWPDAYEI